MKRLFVAVSAAMSILLLSTVMAWAGEASVFDEFGRILIRAYTEMTDTEGPKYSAYLEVRDEDKEIVPIDQFTVTGVLDTTNPTVTVNPFVIHNNDLSSPDISIALDKQTGIVYIFCTDSILHVMTYTIDTSWAMNGVCGSSNGQSFYSVPTDNLCSAGDPTAVSGSGPWTWQCLGINNGSNANCSASLKVNGACGSANGGSFPSAPTTNLCSAGTPTAVSGSGPWTWQCLGINNGSNANCSADIQITSSIDLTGVSINAPSYIANGFPFYFDLTIRNQGTQAAGAFSVKCYIDSTQGPVVFTWNVPSLGAGQSISTSQTLTVTGLMIHAYHNFIVVVDSGNIINETSETNNTLTHKFFVPR